MAKNEIYLIPVRMQMSHHTQSLIGKAQCLYQVCLVALTLEVRWQREQFIGCLGEIQGEKEESGGGEEWYSRVWILLAKLHIRIYPQFSNQRCSLPLIGVTLLKELVHRCQ